MKALVKAILAVATTTILALSASAAISYGQAGQAYIGVKAGQFDIDKIVGHNGDLTAYGVYGGYNFDQNFGIEAEYQGSESDKYTYLGRQYELKAKTYGVYGTYQHQFVNTPVYVKGKLGVARTEVEDKSVGSNSYRYETDDTSLAGGVGVGFKPTNNFGVEATYNYLSSDANVWGVGAHLAF